MGKHITVIENAVYKNFGNNFQRDKFKNYNFLKLYLVELKFKDSGETFHKIGITSKMDAAERFTPNEYRPNYIMFEQPVRVLASAILPVDKAFEWEEYFHNKYPKNIHIKEFFTGISEATLLNKSERFYCIRKIMDLNKEYKLKRFKSRL